ncbi:MAG TPA: UDP-N-acetylmuramoyl-L-alanine--D-glutamate ligase, partial [Acidimicrobiales bacterium]|nr:UDP-N-acetylmuramoyl-L-alanine--D-glutamate ligase [Acidimicrobiales bacterium]
MAATMPDRVLVIGLGVTGEAVVRQLRRRDVDVTLVDDRVTDATRATAARLGVALAADADMATLVAAVDVVCPSPGVPFAHPAIQAALASGTPVWSEFELAARWDDRPVLAITGTNGKTTVTTMVTEMVIAGGRRAVAAGNNDLPLVDALDDRSVEVFVVEASSFRLEFTETFRPRVAGWLNLTPDHLDWHPDVEHYARAKARIWQWQHTDDVAVANADDAEVMRWARTAPGRVVTFSLDAAAAAAGDVHYAADAGALVRIERGAGVERIAGIDDLARALPHDLRNALAAVAIAREGGVDLDACARVLRSFSGLPHRVQLVGDAGGVRWYDDSKATTPASVVAAIEGFESAVLIAGGRNKGLDLSGLRALSPRLRAVVAIGEAAPLVAATFEGATTVVTASSMDEAVDAAAEHARPGDAVVLSPACASFDWYRSYGERGDDYARAVNALAGTTGGTRGNRS